MHTVLGHFYLDIEFWPHFCFFLVWSISPILQLTFLEYVLCKTNSFGGICHVTVTFLVFFKVREFCKMVREIRKSSKVR